MDAAILESVWTWNCILVSLVVQARRRAISLVVEMFTTESFTFCTTSTVTVRRRLIYSGGSPQAACGLASAPTMNPTTANKQATRRMPEWVVDP